MLIYLYTFNKRENSTKRPSGTGEAFNCVLKQDTSVVSPDILIDFDDQDAPQVHLYNYAYIPDLGRYYFIADQRILRGKLWEFTLTCDIMATYKTDVSAATLYLLRCSSRFDGDIVDNYYPVQLSHQTVTKTVTTPWIHNNTENIRLDLGCFILGILANPANDPASAFLGSVHYVALDADNLQALVNYLMDAGTLTSGNITIDGLSNEAVKSVIDPLSYIKSCQWCPVLYADVSEVESTGLRVWSWTASTVRYKRINTAPPYYVWSVSFADIPRHPDAVTRGNYLNCAPYTSIYVNIPPFGIIELDTTLVSQVSQIVGTVIYDLVTGTGVLEIHYGAALDGPPAVRLKSQIGVPIQLSQVYNDYISAAGGFIRGAVETAKGAAMGALFGDFSGAITGATSMIGSAVDAMRPVLSSMGGNGGFSDLRGMARLYATFYDPAPEDLDHVGRPLCQNVVMSTITAGSYCLAMDGDVSITGTAGEQQRLKAYLEGGFYYE